MEAIEMVLPHLNNSLNKTFLLSEVQKVKKFTSFLDHFEDHFMVFMDHFTSFAMLILLKSIKKKKKNSPKSLKTDNC